MMPIVQLRRHSDPNKKGGQAPFCIYGSIFSHMDVRPGLTLAFNLFQAVINRLVTQLFFNAQ